MEEFSKRTITDRRFEIGGVVLEWQYPQFDDLFDLYADDEAAVGNGNVTTAEDVRAQYHRRVKQIEVFLIEDSVEPWRQVVARKEDPIPPFLIGEVWTWLNEVATNRPTQPPSGLAPGGGNEDPSSPDESPSTEEPSSP